MLDDAARAPADVGSSAASFRSAARTIPSRRGSRSSSTARAPAISLSRPDAARVQGRLFGGRLRERGGHQEERE